MPKWHPSLECTPLYVSIFDAGINISVKVIKLWYISIFVLFYHSLVN